MLQVLAEIPLVAAISPAEKAVLRCVLYFDVFEYPLTRAEIFENLSHVCTRQDSDSAVDELTAKEILKEFAGFVFLSTTSAGIIEKRVHNNLTAAKAMKKALRYSRLISRFPFVEGLCISGSLSKGVLDEDGDVDYFIITRPSRLWLCRSLLVIYKK